MASYSYAGWGTSVTFSRTSALIVFNGGGAIYGFWTPNSIPTLVKVSGYDVDGISVAKTGDSFVVSWSSAAACLALY